MGEGQASRSPFSRPREIPSQDLTRSPAFRVPASRFRTEARTAAQRPHHSIVVIHEGGKIVGQQFLSMDCVDGHSQGERVRTSAAIEAANSGNRAR